MSELEINLTRSQLINNDVLFLVAANLYGYFLDSPCKKREKVCELFSNLFLGIEELAPKEAEHPDRLEELWRLNQTFKIKDYFVEILNELELNSVVVKYPPELGSVALLQNHIQDYLLGIFIIKVSGN